MASVGETAANCNRHPFLSGDGCDRGSVDIHQFDDLPYCESISPTEPDIPPEIVDTPLNLLIPPSCSCVNIDYKLEIGYSRSKTFGANATFRARGDCCEGNYQSDFNLQIPCPIDGQGSKKIDISIKYGNGKSEDSIDYISTDSSKCSIDPKDVDFDLEIPCPIGKDGEITVGIGYGDGESKVTKKIISTDNGECKIDAESPEFDLKIHCPIIGAGGYNYITTKAQYAGRFSENKVAYIVKDSPNCTIEPLDPYLTIDVPCPIYESNSNGVTVKIEYGDGKSSATQKVVYANRSKCTIEPLEANFNLNIRCPFRRAYAAPWESIGNDRYRLKSMRRLYFRWHQSDPVFEDSVDFITVDTKGCTFDVAKADIDLDIPCPLYDNGLNKTLTIRPRYGSGRNEMSILEYDRDKCAIGVAKGSFDLAIDCPIGATAVGLRYNLYGRNQFDSVQRLDGGGCYIGGSANFTIDVPCPLANLSLFAGDGISISTSKGTTGGSCWANFTINNTRESGGGGFGFCAVTSLEFVNGTLYFSKECFDSNGNRTSTNIYDVFTATSHMSDHVCCLDT